MVEDIKSQTPTRSLRVKFFLTGALFPLLCIGTAIISKHAANIVQPWQTGYWRDYAAMLLAWPGISPFLPFVAFSLTCLSLWTWRPALGERFLIQGGIWTGAVLASQFLVIVLLVSGPITLIAAVILGPALALIVYLCRKMAMHARRFTIAHLILFTALCALLSLLVKFVGPLDFVMIAGTHASFWVLAGTPTVNVVTYLRATRFTLEPAPRRSIAIPAALAWLAAWATSWKFGVDLMLAEYAKLPTTNPNCYVSAAAAYGHRRFVGTEVGPAWLGRSGSNVGLVNMQMRRLKFLEFALAAAWPSGHRQLRRAYDYVGPCLAALCRRNQWFADLTFVALKPLEWCSEVTRMLANVPAARVAKLYRCRILSTEYSEPVKEYLSRLCGRGRPSGPGEGS